METTLIPLTKAEIQRLTECEGVIERGLNTFYEVGAALAEIKESGLYRAAYLTFENYCQERWQMKRAHAYRLIDSATVIDNLSPIGDIPKTESQARELSSFEPEIQKAVWQVALKTAPVNGDGKPAVTAAHIKSVADVLTDLVATGGLDDGSGEIKPIGTLVDAAITEETYERLMRQKEYVRTKVAANHEETDGDEWYTPDEYLESARKVLGKIDLDPATTAIAQEIVQAGKHYTKEDDGLLKRWFGNVWLNPPYSYPLVEKFTSHLIAQFDKGNVKAAICLTNNCTDAAWFQSLVERFPVCFTRGRISFWQPNQKSFAARQGQVFFYLGKDAESFIEEFSQYGPVLIKA
jgi:ParB family chromosome partitioning protein